MKTTKSGLQAAVNDYLSKVYLYSNRKMNATAAARIQDESADIVDEIISRFDSDFEKWAEYQKEMKKVHDAL